MLYSIISMNNRIKTLVTAIAITAFALTALAACGGEPEIVGVRGAAGAGDPVFPTLGNGGYDVSHYDLDLNIDPDANTLAGVATIDVRATENLEAFNFDFAGPDVSSVRVNDEPAKFTREGIELTIEPAKMIPNDSDFTVVVAYGGTPEPFLFSDFDKINGWFPFEGSVLLASGGFQWYPNNQTPADPATYTMRLTVPKPLTATATGKLTATVDNGDTSTYVWETTTPVGQALAAVAVTVSDSVLESIPGPNGLTINNYFPAGTPQGTKNRFKVASEIIEHFTGLFGPFPYDSFGITFLEGRMPGSGFSAPGRVFTNVTNQKTLAHEIAHQWFAGSVSVASSVDGWLAEGFSQYAELLWEEHLFGPDAIADGISIMKRNIPKTTRPLAVVNSPTEVIDLVTYFRGALTVHALRVELGDDDFFEVVRTYTDRFQHSFASTADFIAVAEEVSQQDLGEFFDAWLYTEAVPPLG